MARQALVHRRTDQRDKNSTGIAREANDEASIVASSQILDLHSPRGHPLIYRWNAFPHEIKTKNESSKSGTTFDRHVEQAGHLAGVIRVLRREVSP
jgi:hypothetical protein